MLFTTKNALDKRRDFRAALKSGKLLRFPGSYSPMVSMLIEQKGFDGVFYNIVDLLDAIRKTYNPDSQLSDKNLLEMEMNRQIFVLDDFGVQKTSSWVSDRLYALINRRYQDCKTIIITSSIPLMDLQMKVDNRLASRIVEMCMEIEIQVSDYRKGLYEKYQKSPSAFQMQHKRT